MYFSPGNMFYGGVDRTRETTIHKIFVKRRIHPSEKNKVSKGKKQSKKAIGVQRGEKAESQVDSLFFSNQIFVSWRLPSIDWCCFAEGSFFLMRSSVN